LDCSTIEEKEEERKKKKEGEGKRKKERKKKKKERKKKEEEEEEEEEEKRKKERKKKNSCTHLGYKPFCSVVCSVDSQEMREPVAHVASLLFSVYESNDIQTCILGLICHSKYTCRWRSAHLHKSNSIAPTM
jgi:uncharacterized membrane protein YdbT with pleckstrin-like domain